MIVVDASVAVSALLNAGAARALLAQEQLHAPHLVDSEIASVVRRHVIAGRVSADVGWAALDAWRHMGVTRYATIGLLGRVWQLRDNVSAYDAGYVALAEALDCTLATTDARLGAAPGVRCPIVVMPG